MNVSKRYKLSPELIAERQEAVKKAIGNLSVPKFAKKAGIAQSILYKILDGTTTASCSADVIKAIADNADSKSGVTLDLLLRVNGYPEDKNMLPIEEAQGIYKILEKITELMSCNVESEQGIIKDDLFGFNYDYVISTDNGNWYVDDERMMIRWMKYDATDTLDKEIEAYEKAIAKSIFMAQKDAADIRYSVMIDNEEYYKRITKSLKTLKLNNCVSIIYVKFKEGRIIKMLEGCCLDSAGKPYEERLNYGR